MRIPPMLWVIAKLIIASLAAYGVFGMACATEKSSLTKRTGTRRKALKAAIPAGILAGLILFYPRYICGGCCSRYW